jgi:7-alpha-hydroxysteroid dehydrogenase
MTARKVLALIGAGGDFDRAIAVAAAEAGADLALGTVTRDETQEFAINSIANEAWTLGREQFAVVLDSLDASAVAAFAEETWDRYGRCDVLVCRHEAIGDIELD